mgnify:CR=1 FL=1
MLVSFLLMVIFFSGCTPREDVKQIDLSDTAQMEGRIENSQRIRIGIVPEQNIIAMAGRYEPLAHYLGEKLKTKVTLVYLSSYGEVCEKFVYKQLDAAFIGSFNYVLTHIKIGIEPIVRPDYAGVSAYHGLVLVRADSSIQKVSDMQGKRLALVHPATFTGSLYPLYYFKTKGILDIKNYFSKIFFTNSHENAILALLQNEADVAIVKDQVYFRMARKDPDIEKNLTVVASSEPVPTNTFCVRKELDPAMKEKLRDLLCSLDKDPNAESVLKALGGASKFVETRDEDYHLIYAIAKQLDINLRTYPYNNEFQTEFSKDK